MKHKLPEPIIKDEKIFCPDCNKECPSKQSYNMHWFRTHTKNFNRPKKQKVIKRKYQKKQQIIPTRLAVNFCPNCGFSLTPILMAMNLITK